MPVRRRKAKRRVNPATEAEAWESVFSCGCDFFGEAADLSGVAEPVSVWPQEVRAEAEKEWTAAARTAWGRVGRLYIETLHDPAAGEPWVLEQFGEPETCQWNDGAGRRG